MLMDKENCEQYFDEKLKEKYLRSLMFLGQ